MVDWNTETYAIDFSEDELDLVNSLSIPYKAISKKTAASKAHRDGFHYIKFTLGEISQLSEFLASELNRSSWSGDEEDLISDMIDRLDATLRNTAGHRIIE